MFNLKQVSVWHNGVQLITFAVRATGVPMSDLGQKAPFGRG